MTRILGVDPGATGAIALLDTATGALTVHDLPVIVVKKAGARKASEISESHLAHLIREMAPDIAWVERVHAMPKQGVSSSFNFGVAYGIVRGVIGALPLPMLFVTPNEWKREFRLGSDKSQSRVLAGRMYPNNAHTFSRVRDDGRAEAVLIATFGARYPL